MKRGKKEVSDKVIIALLIVAVVVSVFGAYMVYDYSQSYGSDDADYGNTGSYSAGHVTLSVVDLKEEVDIDENIE